MKNLRSTAGEFTPDSLFADIAFPLQTGSVLLAASQGVLLRGTVVGKNTDGKFVPAVTGASEIVAHGILADDVDTGTTDTVAVVYTSGSFNRAALIFGGDDTPEDHEDVLRTKGIYLKAVL